jgi:hypothetical protein
MQVMEHYRTVFTGQWVARCPECGAVAVCWDADDLNEDGQLVCQCEGGQ